MKTHICGKGIPSVSLDYYYLQKPNYSALRGVEQETSSAVGIQLGAVLGIEHSKLQNIKPRFYQGQLEACLYI